MNFLKYNYPNIISTTNYDKKSFCNALEFFIINKNNIFNNAYLNERKQILQDYSFLKIKKKFLFFVFLFLFFVFSFFVFWVSPGSADDETISIAVSSEVRL